MAEFAVAFPFALLLVLGIIQLGLMYTAKEIVNILCASARDFCSFRTQVDDMTAIIIKAESAA